MNYRGFAARCLIGAAALGALTASAAAQDEKVFKLGVVAFLSGPAAESFGKPAWDGAKTVIDALNAGAVIKPYDQVGFGGLKIEVDLIDEAGGATKQVEELRNAFERDHVDAVLGYISSGDCLAVAPAAEQLKRMLRADGLRHAAHLRGEQVQIRLPFGGAWRRWITSPWPATW